MMKEILEIASGVSTPLALGGLFAAILFLILRQMIVANLFPQVTRAIGGDILKMVIQRLFWLALIAMILGFFGFIFTGVFANRKSPPNSISVNLPGGLKLKEAINFLAQLDNFTVAYNDSCSEALLNTEVQAGAITAKDSVGLIEVLRLRLKENQVNQNYRVTKAQEKGLYEIRCE